MISAIIVNYKTVELTKKAVYAVRKSCEDARIEFEIILIDNSAHETGNELKKALGNSVQLVFPETNLGFARANNLGASVAQGKFLLLINNDAFATKELILRSIEVLENEESVGLYAPSLVYEDQRPQRSTGRFLTLGTLAAEYLFPYRLAQQFLGPHTYDPHYVPTVSGACMVLKRDVYRDLQGFDERFFFTCEDIDLCRRVYKKDKKIYYDDSVVVTHLGGSSQPWNWIRDPYLHRARIRYIQKHFGLFQALLAKAIVAMGRLFRGVLSRSGRTRIVSQ